jgi:Flp pilus assembly pilin Flp
MVETLKRFWVDESGQTFAEYALIIALVSLGLILVLATFRDEIGRVFNAVRKELQNGNTSQVPVS